MSYDEREIIRKLTRISRRLDGVRPWCQDLRYAQERGFDLVRLRREERELRLRLQAMPWSEPK